MTVSNGDYAAPLVIQSKNGFLTSLHRENFRKFLFLNPDFLVGGIISRISMNLSTHYPDRKNFSKIMAPRAHVSPDAKRQWSFSTTAQHRLIMVRQGKSGGHPDILRKIFSFKFFGPASY